MTKTLAGAVAAAMKAEKLVVVSDTHGIRTKADLLALPAAYILGRRMHGDFEDRQRFRHVCRLSQRYRLR